MTELTKLACLLATANIPFELYPFNLNGEATLQIAYPNKKDCIVDAVCNNSSYGGNEGLLEVLVLVRPTINKNYGWLTAEEAFKYFDEIFSKS